MKKTRKKIASTVISLSLILCLTGCGNVAPTSGGVEENKENVENELPENMNASDVADMLESGMTVDEVIDKVEEIKEEEAAETDKPVSPTPTETPKPTATPEPTPEPTPTPPPHVHEWTESVTRQPSCASEGEKKLTCECGETRTEAIPATGNHSWVEGTTVVHHEALGHVEMVETQVQVGTTEGRTEYACGYCGARFDTPSAKTDHCASYVGVDNGHAIASTIAYDYPGGEPIFETRTESVWKVDQDAWDETVGTGTYTCSVCGATK